MCIDFIFKNYTITQQQKNIIFETLLMLGEKDYETINPLKDLMDQTKETISNKISLINTKIDEIEDMKDDIYLSYDLGRIKQDKFDEKISTIDSEIESLDFEKMMLSYNLGVYIDFLTSRVDYYQDQKTTDPDYSHDPLIVHEKDFCDPNHCLYDCPRGPSPSTLCSLVKGFPEILDNDDDVSGGGGPVPVLLSFNCGDHLIPSHL